MKKLEGQKMSVLPPRLAVPFPVFTHVGLDLAGPFIVKREKTTISTRGNPGKMKVWAALFVCLTVKAVKIYMIRGYSTEDFLLAWDEFVADCGQPLTVHTDRGSQLVAAGKESEEVDRIKYDWGVISKSTQGKTDWHYTPPGAQFRNGALEVFVKKFKRTLEHRFKDKTLSMMEMNVAVKVVSSVLNSRPISAMIRIS